MVVKIRRQNLSGLVLACAMLTGNGMAQSCPVQFEKVKASETFGPNTSFQHHYFSAKWKNTSGKTIIGMKFQGAFLNTLRESEDVYVPWVTDVTIRPDHSQWGVWQDDYYAYTHDTKYAENNSAKGSLPRRNVLGG